MCTCVLYIDYVLLIEAAQEERMRCIQVLLSSGADGNVQDARGWSLIHQGAWDGDLEAVKYLGNLNTMKKYNSECIERCVYQPSLIQ